MTHDDRTHPDVPRDDLTPDPTLGAALRDVLANPPLEAVDWAALERRIADRTALPLRRRRSARRRDRPAPWWELTAAWARAAIPLGAAAGIAAGVLAVTAPAARSSTPSEREVLLSAATATLSDHDAAETLVGTTSGDWLLGEAVGAASAQTPSPSRSGR
ncbi:MAG: hypothetical protein ACJ79S_19515 [Gemmatimonadaceae bacterium]